MVGYNTSKGVFSYESVGDQYSQLSKKMVHSWSSSGKLWSFIVHVRVIDSLAENIGEEKRV